MHAPVLCHCRVHHPLLLMLLFVDDNQANVGGAAADGGDAGGSFGLYGSTSRIASSAGKRILCPEGHPPRETFLRHLSNRCLSVHHCHLAEHCHVVLDSLAKISQRAAWTVLDGAQHSTLKVSHRSRRPTFWPTRLEREMLVTKEWGACAASGPNR